PRKRVAIDGSATKPTTRLVTVIPSCAPESCVDKRRKAFCSETARRSPDSARRATAGRSTVTKANSAATNSAFAAMSTSTSRMRNHSGATGHLGSAKGERTNSSGRPLSGRGLEPVMPSYGTRTRRGGTRPSSQPPPVTREASCGAAVRRPELAHRLRQVVAHRALGQVQLARNLAVGQTVPREAQHLAFPVGQRVGVTPRARGELGVDGASARVHVPHGLSQGARGSVLEQV